MFTAANYMIWFNEEPCQGQKDINYHDEYAP